MEDKKPAKPRWSLRNIFQETEDSGGEIKRKSSISSFFRSRRKEKDEENEGSNLQDGSNQEEIYSWLKGAPNQTGVAGVVNPMLHMSLCDHTHNAMLNKSGLLNEDLWEGIDDDSSIESFNSAPVDKELTIDEKLQVVFELPEVEKFQQEFACWMIRSVLLKGYMYITENHICFYSSLPSTPGPVRKEGFLQKRTRRRPQRLFQTFWFVLKTDGLYIYGDTKVFMF